MTMANDDWLIGRDRHDEAAGRIYAAAARLMAILDSVREAIAGLTGPERVVTATTVALQRLRADPLAKVLRSMAPPPGEDWVTDSPIVTQFAVEMVGLSTTNPLAAQWLIRTFLALWYWPLKNGDAENEMMKQFLGPPYAVDTNIA